MERNYVTVALCIPVRLEVSELERCKRAFGGTTVQYCVGRCRRDCLLFCRRDTLAQPARRRHDTATVDAAVNAPPSIHEYE